MSAPRPLTLSLLITTRVSCSTCDAIHDVPELPLTVVDVDAPPILDRRALHAQLPEGWRVGAMKPLGMGLHLPGVPGAPPPDAKAMPVAFCPACPAPRSGS